VSSSQTEKQVLPVDRVQRVQLGRRLAAVPADGDVDDVVRPGRVHETVARATARRQTGDGRVHRAGRQGEVRAEDTAAGAHGPRTAARTAAVADQVDRRHMSAVIPGACLEWRRSVFR